MATLRKIGTNYYVRMRLPGGREKTISTGTGNRREAERKLKLVKDNMFLLKAGLKSEAELEELDLQNAKERFIKDRQLNGLRKTTIDSYELSLDNLLSVNSPSVPVSSLTKTHIKKMVEKLKEDKLKDSTINIRTRSVNAFTKWLLTEGYILESLALSLIRVDDPLPKFLTPDELDSFYAQKMKPKMRSTFKVFEGLGIRLSELQHSTLDGNFVIIPAEYSKSRRDRMIPIPEDLKYHYRISMDHPYKPHSITRAFRRYADKVDPPIKKTLHSMRHTYALRALQMTKNIVAVKELLGHSDIKTTMIYTKFPPEYISEMLKVESPEPVDGIVGHA